MAEREGAAQLRGDQKKLLCFCAARTLAIVNSGASRVPKSGLNASTDPNGTKTKLLQLKEPNV